MVSLPRRPLSLLLTTLLLAACTASPTPPPDTTAQTTIENKGSDTMGNLALARAEACGGRGASGGAPVGYGRRVGHRPRRADQRHGGHRERLTRDQIGGKRAGAGERGRAGGGRG